MTVDGARAPAKRAYPKQASIRLRWGYEAAMSGRCRATPIRHFPYTGAAGAPWVRDKRARKDQWMRVRFDRIFRRRTGFTTLDRLLARLHANKAKLLMVLDRPGTPLHTNGSENDIRCQVTRRKINAGTRSDAGRDCRDAFLGLAKTCTKLGVAFWDYLGSRLEIPGQCIFRTCQVSSAAAASPPDTAGCPGLCRYYGPSNQRAQPGSRRAGSRRSATLREPRGRNEVPRSGRGGTHLIERTIPGRDIRRPRRNSLRLAPDSQTAGARAT